MITNNSRAEPKRTKPNIMQHELTRSFASSLAWNIWQSSSTVGLLNVSIAMVIHWCVSVSVSASVFYAMRSICVKAITYGFSGDICNAPSILYNHMCDLCRSNVVNKDRIRNLTEYACDSKTACMSRLNEMAE